jgi:hypothetical protein
MDIPRAIAGIYNFSQNVIGLRSTCFALEVSAFIKKFITLLRSHLRQSFGRLRHSFSVGARAKKAKALQKYFYRINPPIKFSCQPTN